MTVNVTGKTVEGRSVKAGAYLGSPKTPAVTVRRSMSPTDLGSMLEALAYWVLMPSPDGTKNAPFTIMSPSVLQFQSAQSPSLVSTRFVTCVVHSS